MHIVGLVGPAGSGKTTVGNYLVEKYGYRRMAFADSLKDMIITAGICTHDECYGKKTEYSRKMLQLIGTEVFRKQVHSEYWIQQMGKKLSALPPDAKVVIDDIRFPNEAKLVRAYPGSLLVKLERADFVDETAGTTHESESLLHTIGTDHVIRAASGDLHGLFTRIDEIAGCKHPLISNCCSASKPSYEEGDICPKCKEHCEWEEDACLL